MAAILGVGNATVDIINVVDGYPPEDAEVRALSQRIVRGGNTANTLVVLAQFGHRCQWAGSLAEERDADVIVADLAGHGVGVAFAYTAASGKVPTSYVTLNRRTGSRTIVHYRDLPEYPAASFDRIDLARFDWVHFEGRNVEAIEAMLERVRRERPQLRCSLEVEKARPGIERLFGRVDLLLLSRGYALSVGETTPEGLLQRIADSSAGADRVCAWGRAGARGLDTRGKAVSTPAFVPPETVDTLGAGDVFNAGVIDARLRGLPLGGAIESAAQLAGLKCGREGFAGLAAAFRGDRRSARRR